MNNPITGIILLIGLVIDNPLLAVGSIIGPFYTRYAYLHSDLVISVLAGLISSTGFAAQMGVDIGLRRAGINHLISLVSLS